LLSRVCYYKLKEKKRKRKEILNNDLAILPSHDTLLEYAEDSEEDETPVQTREAKYEQGDRLFMIQILPEPTAEDLRAASTTSQKLAEEAC